MSAHDPAIVVALQAAPTVKALTGRLGHFNDAWWKRFATEVLDALAAQGLVVLDPQTVFDAIGKHGGFECCDPRTLDHVMQSVSAILAAEPER